MKRLSTRQRMHSGPVQVEPALQVSVAKKRKRMIRDKSANIGRFHKIFIFIHRGTMNQTEVLHGHWTNR